MAPLGFPGRPAVHESLTMPVPATDTPALPTFADVKRAAGRIAGTAHRTPVLTSRTADAMSGASLFFKAENLQRGGAFKFRGAYNAISALPEEVRRRGVIAFSSGNHAQAIALASRLLGVPAVIVMPEDAPQVKVEATRGYGAEVVSYDRYSQDREVLGREIAQARGLTLIPPYDHPDVIAGQGTLALELIEETGPSTCWSPASAGEGNWPAAPWRRRNSPPASRSTASSRRRATTGAARSMRAGW